MTIAPDMDPKVICFKQSSVSGNTDVSSLKEALKNFLEGKTSMLSDIESRCIAMTEKKERILAEISQFKV